MNEAIQQKTGRRNLLKYAGFSLLGSFVGNVFAPRSAQANPALAHAMWVHGHSMQIEYPNRLNWVQRTGFSTKVQSKGPMQPNWFHFAIPTPVIVNDKRLRVGSVLIRFRSAGQAYVKAIHVYDGEKKIASKENIKLSPPQWQVEKVSVPNNSQIFWGLGISILVDFGIDTPREIEFSAAGCDFLL